MRHMWKAVVGLATGTVLLGAATLAWAAIPGPGGLIHACYDTNSGQTRIYDSEGDTPKGCGKNETAISWNQTGPVGPTGRPAQWARPALRVRLVRQAPLALTV